MNAMDNQHVRCRVLRSRPQFLIKSVSHRRENKSGVPDGITDTSTLCFFIDACDDSRSSPEKKKSIVTS